MAALEPDIVSTDESPNPRKTLSFVVKLDVDGFSLAVKTDRNSPKIVTAWATGGQHWGGSEWSRRAPILQAG